MRIRGYKDFLSPEYDPRTMAYRDSPTFRGFPLGGIGNGGISIYADGDFSEARINHNWFLAIRDLRGSFFALRTKDAGGNKAAKLLRRTHHHSREFAVDTVAHTVFRGEVPFFTLDYLDDGLPVDCSLSGFSPLIPHNTKDSSLPVVLFDLSVKNRTDEPVEVSVLFSWQNILGITGTGGSFMIRKHTFRCDFSRFNYAALPGDGICGVKFLIDKDFDPGDTRRRAVGSHLIFTEPKDDWDVTECIAWSERAAVPAFWEDFLSEGSIRRFYPERSFSRRRGMPRPEAADSIPQDLRHEEIGEKSGAICVRTTLPPRGTTVVPFGLAWYNPHYVLQKEARKKIKKKVRDGIDHGIYAGNSFGSVEQIARYAGENKEALRKESRMLSETMRDPRISNLPDRLVNTMLNAADSLITNSVLTRDGSYYTIEGTDWQLFHRFAHVNWPFGGLTGTNDQRLSSHPYTATFLPGLDKSELVTFRDLARLENGKVPHGNGGAEIALADADTPYSRPIPIINGGKNDWPDLTCSEILQLGKLVRTTGDLDLLIDSWDDLVAMSDYLETLVEDNVPEGSSTYDVFTYEPCFLYHATLFVSANRMLADLAVHVPEEIDRRAKERAAVFGERADRAHETLSQKLWSEKEAYYRASEKNPNLFQGGLAGDWIARYAGLDPAVEPKRARSHNLVQYKALVESAKSSGPLKTRFGGRPLPFNEADPSGKEAPFYNFGVQKKHGFNYIYQVVSYQALEGIYLGNGKEGLATIDMIYDKAYHEGYPWDMNLLGLPGFVYMTHPVLWALPNALSGAAIDLLTGTLYLSPRPFPGKKDLLVPVFFPYFWLSIAYDGEKREGMVTVIKAFEIEPAPKRKPASLRGGSFVLDRLVVTGPDDARREIDTGGFEIHPGNALRFSL